MLIHLRKANFWRAKPGFLSSFLRSMRAHMMPLVLSDYYRTQRNDETMYMHYVQPIACVGFVSCTHTASLLCQCFRAIIG